MALHRGGRLRHAEVFLRQGLLDRAIEEHVRVTTERPDDWPALVALGNLYLRARSVERAAAVFERVAGRAAAVAPPAKALSLHEAILKFAPRSEPVRLHAAHALKTLAVESAAAGRLSESLALCERAANYDPSDGESRALLARAAIDRGDVAAARAWLASQADTRDILLCRLELHVLEADAEAARPLAEHILHAHPDTADVLAQIACRHAARSTPAAFECLAAVVDRAADGQDFGTATSALKNFCTHAPDHVPALMRLVEICIDAGLDADLDRAQHDLADAYLAAGQAREARVIAEDLALREPWSRANIDRFRRALTMLGEADPDRVIAESLCGDSPFAMPGPQPPGGGPRESSPPIAAAPPEPASPAARAARGEADDIHATPPLGTLAISARQKAALAIHAEGHTAAAIAALRREVRSPEHRFESAILLARLYEESGELHEAAEWFERATMAAPARSASHDVLYDLGRALMAAGESDRALAVFLELRAETPGFRDVAFQIARLEHAREPRREGRQAAAKGVAVPAAVPAAVPPAREGGRRG